MGNKIKHILGLAYTSKEKTFKWIKITVELRGKEQEPELTYIEIHKPGITELVNMGFMDIK